MKRFRRGCATLVIALLLGSGPGGCGGGGAAKSLSDSTGEDKLEGICEKLKVVRDDNSKPPAKLAELERGEPLLPLSAAALRNGDIVYIWGAGLSTDGKASSTLIAHERTAQSEGGWVLMGDGQVKQMSATEFAAAPKARP